MPDVTIKLVGTTPLLMHNPQMVDPEHPIVREIKALSSKRKKTEDDLRRMESLEWWGGLYTQNGDGPERIVQPTSKVHKCIVNTGKISKLGTAVTRALVMEGLHIPLAYDGPDDPEEVFKDQKFHSRLSVGIGNKRVMRVRPQFMPWSLEAPATLIPDAGLDLDELERLVALAGKVEGIGDGRRIGYGRFEGSVEVR